MEDQNDMLISFSQRDPRWAAMKIPGSNLTIGRFGCTLTCIADLSTYFGGNYNPQDIAGLINFTSQGLIIWQSCKFIAFKFDRREYGRNDANIQAALKDPNRAVILEVANHSHWVVALNTALRIADPWLGDKTGISRYGNNITGAAYFKRT